MGGAAHSWDFRGHVGRCWEQGFETHSDPSMAGSPRLASLRVTTCLESKQQKAREMGWFPQGRANTTGKRHKRPRHV